MSIATEIQRLAQAKADIKAAIEEKGVEVGDGTLDTYAAKISEITGGGGSAEGCVTVTFMNGTNVLLTRPVYIGDDCPDPLTQGRIETPTKESTPQYNYTHSGWTSVDGGTADSSILKNITEDKVVYSAFTETVRKYTITFYDGTTLLHTEQVAYGGTATYTPPKKDGFMFMGWTPEPTNVTSDLECVGAWQESYAFADAPWSYIAQVSESGKASEVFALGDTRTETLNYADGTTEEVELMIASFDLHPDANQKPTITLINKQVLSKVTGFSSSSSGSSGNTYRQGDTIRDFLGNTVIPAFSSELQSVLRETFLEAANMIYPDFYDKISPLSMANVGLNANGTNGVTAETLYSFDGTNGKRIRTLPERTKYWLSNFKYESGYYSYAGSIYAPSGAYSKASATEWCCVLFKIFV